DKFGEFLQSVEIAGTPVHDEALEMAAELVPDDRDAVDVFHFADGGDHLPDGFERPEAERRRKSGRKVFYVTGQHDGLALTALLCSALGDELAKLRIDRLDAPCDLPKEVSAFGSVDRRNGADARRKRLAAAVRGDDHRGRGLQNRANDRNRT